MNILLINTPSRKGEAGFMLPLGLLYVSRIIEDFGATPKILDPYLFNRKLENFDKWLLYLDKTIEEFKPDIVGFGGIATSYPKAKQISLHVKKNFPEIFQIAGGPLASTYEYLLNNTGVNVVFHGETEISLPLFLERFINKKQFYDIQGISFKKNGKIIRNPPQEQIKNIDTIPFPAYHIVELKEYFHNIKDWLNSYNEYFKDMDDESYKNILERIGSHTYYFDIISGRGCTHKCLFCYRHVFGIRKHSVNYVIEHIKFLQKNYGLNGFEFDDELFNLSTKWTLDFCDAIEKNNLKIFYMIGGARADFINKTVLERLKQTGCIEVSYGHESGSDKILNEYGKGITVQKNIETTLITKEVGIPTTIQLVIGAPSETTQTIHQTVKFLKDVDGFRYSLNYLIPLPETPIWNYVIENNLLVDIESYLEKVADHGGWQPINLTKLPDKIWRRWSDIIYREMKLYYAKKKNKKLLYLYFLFRVDKLKHYFKILLKLFIHPSKSPYYFGRLYKKIKFW